MNRQPGKHGHPKETRSAALISSKIERVVSFAPAYGDGWHFAFISPVGRLLHYESAGSISETTAFGWPVDKIRNWPEDYLQLFARPGELGPLIESLNATGRGSQKLTMRFPQGGEARFLFHVYRQKEGTYIYYRKVSRKPPGKPVGNLMPLVRPQAGVWSCAVVIPGGKLVELITPPGTEKIALGWDLELLKDDVVRVFENPNDRDFLRGILERDGSFMKDVRVISPDGTVHRMLLHGIKWNNLYYIFYKRLERESDKRKTKSKIE